MDPRLLVGTVLANEMQKSFDSVVFPAKPCMIYLHAIPVKTMAEVTVTFLNFSEICRCPYWLGEFLCRIQLSIAVNAATGKVVDCSHAVKPCLVFCQHMFCTGDGGYSR